MRIPLPRLLTPLVALLVLLPAMPALAEDPIVVTGSGWGHGIGLSQYGMNGQAAEGKTAEQIVSYYYKDAWVADMNAAITGGNRWVIDSPEPLWVNLLQNPSSTVVVPRGGWLTFCQNEPPGLVLGENHDSHWVWELESTLVATGHFGGTPDTFFANDTTNAVKAFQASKGLSQDGVVGAATRAHLWPLDANGENCVHEISLQDGVAFTLTVQGGGTCQLSWTSAAGSCVGSIRGIHPGVRLELPAKHYPTDTCSTNCPQQFGHGTFRFRPGGSPGTMHLVIQIGVEDYVSGIAEVPLNSAWRDQALRAQAIVARSYGVDRALGRGSEPQFSPGERQDCWCHLYSTTLSQVYSGWNRETISGGRWNWAADATNRLIVSHSTRQVVPTFYSSSSGGATENNEEVWGGTALPFLRSVPDPWALNPAINPNASWSFSFNSSQVAATYGFSSVHRVFVSARNTSGSARTVTISGVQAGGLKTIEVGAGSFRFSMGLKSQYFSVDWTGALVVPGGDRPVLHDPTTGKWTYRNIDGALSTIYYGVPKDTAFMGDWNCDGIDTPGLYRRSDGYVYLRNSNTQGIADINYFFGIPGDIPIAGDFNGNGCDTVSIYRPSEARFYIINTIGGGNAGLGHAEYSYLYGIRGDVPFVGDWNGDNIDTPGLRRNSNGFVYLRNSNTQGVADIDYFYGISGDIVFAGDWNNDGVDTLGLYRPSNGTVYLRDTNTTGVADVAYQMGGKSHRPVAGTQ